MLKDIQGTPKEWKCTKPFLALKRCNIILNSIPGLMQDMYWSQRGEHFPTKVETFQTKLILIESKYLEKKELLKGVHNNCNSLTPTKVKTAMGVGVSGTKCTLDNPNPCKQLGTNLRNYASCVQSIHLR